MSDRIDRPPARCVGRCGRLPSAARPCCMKNGMPNTGDEMATSRPERGFPSRSHRVWAKVKSLSSKRPTSLCFLQESCIPGHYFRMSEQPLFGQQFGHVSKAANELNTLLTRHWHSGMCGEAMEGRREVEGEGEGIGCLGVFRHIGRVSVVAWTLEID